MFIALVALINSSGCAKHVSVARPVSVGHSETGIASWYGEPFQGRKTASGEVYDMNQLTAAHRTLPFGTWVEVTNLVNAKRVEVRITDRGPFIDGRIIDLSKAAAKQIDLITAGIVRVRLKVIRAPKLVPENVTSNGGKLKLDPLCADFRTGLAAAEEARAQHST